MSETQCIRHIFQLAGVFDDACVHGIAKLQQAFSPYTAEFESLATLGRPVLHSEIAAQLYEMATSPSHAYAVVSEGDMVQVGSSCIASGVARRLKLQTHWTLSKAHEHNISLRDNNTVLARTLYALVAAMYADGKARCAVRPFVRACWKQHIDELTSAGHVAHAQSDIDRLTKHFQATYKATPRFDVQLSANASINTPRFEATVYDFTEHFAIGKGTGRSKQQAKLQAATSALTYLAKQDTSFVGSRSN